MGLYPDRQWAFIRPFLPPPARTGRPRADDRQTINGILYVLVTGCRWQDLPREYGAPTTVWRRLKRWGADGIWERIWRAALAALDRQGQLDWTLACLDGSFVPAKNGGEKVGLTRKGKGAKWMLVIDGNGMPLGFHLDSAQVAEVRLAERTLDTVAVARPRGRPRQRPDKLVADRGYDRGRFRHTLRRRGIQMCIPSKPRPSGARDLEGEAGTPGGGAQSRLSLALQGGTQLRLAGRLPTTAHPLGAPVRRLPGLVRGRAHAALRARPQSGGDGEIDGAEVGQDIGLGASAFALS
jgi:transposase